MSRRHDDRPVHCDLEAERAVLGACLVNPDAFAIAAGTVQPADFWRTGHAVVFRTMHRLHLAQAAIDLVTLKGSLSAGELEEAGGPVYLASLIDGVPRSTNVEHYATLVRAHAESRAVLVQFQRAAGLLADGVPASHVVGVITAALANVVAERPSGNREVSFTPASAIAVQPVRWLWDLRLAMSSLWLIAGREGIGKTLLWVWLTAQLTRGRLPGVHFGVPKAVVVAATEDSWAHTLVPRLMAAGADLSRVLRVEVNDDAAGLSFPRDVPLLDAALTTAVDPALLVVDPLMSRLDAGLDSHKDAEIRQALEPLAALAERRGISIAGLIHVNKTASSDALNSVMGSRAFTAVARGVLFVMVDPQDEGVRLVGLPKCNIGRTDLPTLSFRVEGAKVAETSEGPIWTGRLAWTGETDRSIREALESTAGGDRDRTATTEAGEWLVDYLAAQGGCVDSAIVRREGAKVGHSKDALNRARAKFNVRSVSSGFPRRAFWSSPATVDATAGRAANTANTANTTNTGAGETSSTSLPPLGSVDAVNAVFAAGEGIQPAANTEASRDYERI